ncbi:hypothetical protein [Marinobacter qingdaonensis]|uniref:Uncharacterized protein n=1 Tax=Marinobacter qingdaonensis TaxID=3108486 RepID=A0ABU5P0W1_9GAMM|nr:hypothetical protein [Marinobacter sp. ASW11-75]MEA1081694.1 hypothetical protein [Marinobacter sp. ASW11-75]
MASVDTIEMAPEYLNWVTSYYAVTLSGKQEDGSCLNNLSVELGNDELEPGQAVSMVELATDNSRCISLLKVGITEIDSESAEILSDTSPTESTLIERTVNVENGESETRFIHSENGEVTSTSENSGKHQVGIYTSYTDGNAAIIRWLPREIEVSAVLADLKYPLDWCDNGGTAEAYLGDYPFIPSGWLTTSSVLNGWYGFSANCYSSPRELTVGFSEVIHENDVFPTCAEPIEILRKPQIITGRSDGTKSFDLLMAKRGPSEMCGDWLVRYITHVYEGNYDYSKTTYLDHIVESN